MSDADDDSALLRQQRQFLQQVGFELRHINRTTIHARIPELNRESFMRLATFAAELRSDWLQVALQLSASQHGSSEAAELLATLRERRLAYEEARDAFSALERTIEQGYVDIGA